MEVQGFASLAFPFFLFSWNNTPIFAVSNNLNYKEYGSKEHYQSHDP